MPSKIENHLTTETSPYLKQHASNPVNWYPWGKEAIEKARHEKKPILLSIGYAACHWCHVMAHESFEDEETAELMNKYFVNIKVDREERPDLDKIYQNAHYLITQQSGGWPLTIFLTPDDLTPFFSGTYFPKESRHNLPPFKTVLAKLEEIYQTQRSDIDIQSKELRDILNKELKPAAQTEIDQQPLLLALQIMQGNYDPVWGGFGHAPKFPQSPKLTFLLQYYSSMLTATLKHMEDGGIYDQLQGGFYRYSVDEKWEIPHFEKMLYDNAQLLEIFSIAATNLLNIELANVAHTTANWLMEVMQSNEGGYYSSLDADSEGHEGKYYVWDKEEISGILTEDEFRVFAMHYGLNLSANFDGKWHLHITESLEAIANKENLNLEQINQLITSAKKKLLNVRNKRVAPACDTKMLTAWNSLTIKAMFKAGFYLDKPTYLNSAYKALNFIQEKLWKDKRLLASYSEGKASLSAYLDDYAFLLDALLTSLQIKWNSKHLQFAIEIADCLLDYFSDEANGGFYFTARDHEKLLYRPKVMMDEATPAGNGIAALSLLTLGHLLGETRYLEAAEKTIQAAWLTLSRYPAEHSSLLLALKNYLTPTSIIIIRGNENELEKWQQECKSPAHYLFAIPSNATDLSGELASRKYAGKTIAYVCRGTQCLPPIESLEELRKEVSEILY